MSLRSPAEEENPVPRHAGLDCRHPVRKDASGDIHIKPGFQHSMLE